MDYTEFYTNNDALIITHGNCPDGSCAAWVVYSALLAHGRLPNIFHARFGDEPPYELARGKRVVVVDFSYTLERMERLADVAEEILCLDHHKTAEAALSQLDWCVFDMNRSGAGMAWDHFYPGEPRPWLVDYVEDRDLWRLALPDSRLLADLVSSTPHDLAEWEKLANTPIDMAKLQAIGVQRRIEYVAPLYRRTARQVRWTVGDREYVVPLINCPYFYASRVLEPLVESERAPAFAAAWFVDERGWFFFSLRSTERGLDVSEVAKEHGGGGHRNTSGFQGPHWPLRVQPPANAW